MTSLRVAAVTGASGYLGSLIAKTLESDGWRVVRLVRSPIGGSDAERLYDAAKDVEPGSLDSVDVLVHAAYDLSVTSRDDIWRINVDGTRRLLEAATVAGIRRTIVLSSMSAYEGTRQLYGQAKLDIERLTFAAGGCVVRPGIVFGPNSGGMAGALQKVSRLPVVPLVAGDVRQFVVSEQDLMAAIASLASSATVPSGPVGIACPTPVAFRELMERLAAQKGRTCRFVPVPWRLMYWGLRAAETMRLSLPFRADSLLGLVHPAPDVPGSWELVRLGVAPKSFEGDVDRR